MKIGATLIPLVGWGLDTEDVEGARQLHLEAVRRLVDQWGFQAVELNGDFSILYPGIFDGAYYERVAEVQQELGFACTVHLPFLWLDGLSLAEPIRRASVECVLRVVEWTRPLLVDSYVLHLWGIWSSLLLSVQEMPPKERGLLFDKMLFGAKLTLGEVGTSLASHKLCVENLEHFPFEEITDLVEGQGMRVCLDVGHLTVSGGDALGFLETHWEMIGEIHLHDALPGDSRGPGVRDHLPLGSGCVDYARFLDRLEEGGYDGVVILEVNTEKDLLVSLEQVRPWL